MVGLGPAGFTLSHYLLNDGHTVVAIDGLKIEPLPAEFSGRTPEGVPAVFKPIRDIRELHENLDDRAMAGFGGVAEYGITVRWDKNFLKIIRLLIERRAGFAMFGGVRFGGTLTLEQAFALGFDHVALCLGAGKPTILDMPHQLAPGVRMASDFLMALQLTGAAKAESIANLQLRLPAVVIGGGLTAIDTATEALAYYPRPGGEIPRPLRDPGGRARRGRGARGLDAGREPRSPRNSSPMPGPSAPSGRGPRPRRRGAAADDADGRMGRRHHRLSPAHDRFAELHPQSRGGREGPPGRHPLRRGADADGDRGR